MLFQGRCRQLASMHVLRCVRLETRSEDVCFLWKSLKLRCYVNLSLPYTYRCLAHVLEVGNHAFMRGAGPFCQGFPALRIRVSKAATVFSSFCPNSTSHLYAPLHCLPSLHVPLHCLPIVECCLQLPVLHTRFCTEICLRLHALMLISFFTLSPSHRIVSC